MTGKSISVALWTAGRDLIGYEALGFPVEVLFARGICVSREHEKSVCLCQTRARIHPTSCRLPLYPRHLFYGPTRTFVFRVSDLSF